MDALNVLEFFLFEPFDAALHEGRMTLEAYNEATGPFLEALFPSVSAGRLVEMPDGSLMVAPSWWDEDEWDRGILPPDAGMTAAVDPAEAERAMVLAAWGALRGEAKSET